MQKKIVCFDIDGTLANLDHRRIFVKSKPKNWNAFKAGIPHDTPIPQTVFLAQILADRDDVEVLIVSARGDETRDVTAQWLKDQGIFYDQLYMRAENDYRKDSIVKTEILAMIREKHGEPFMVFDDRGQVIDECWLANNIYTFEVSQGMRDF